MRYVLSLISKPQPSGGLGPLGLSSHDKKKTASSDQPWEHGVKTNFEL